MALSYFTESEAPRDFRISSTESESHYTKCLLCYTIKKNFYCVDCIKAGNFLHSTMPYSDRFADKQGKLLRLRANRKHVQDRCEALLLNKRKQDSLQIEVKQCRDKVELLKLAIEQRRSNIEERKKGLAALEHHNTELGLKLPRYQKRVAGLAKHAQVQATELGNRASTYNESAESLGSLRRARIRQLTKYIFPVYITYDSSDSVEDMEFLHVETEDSPVNRERLHVVSAWLPIDGDYSFLHRWVSVSAGLPAGEACGAAGRARAALALAAQLTELLAWITDFHLLNPLPFSEVSLTRAEGAEAAAEVEGMARRLCGGVVALGLRAGLPPPPLARHALACLHGLAVAAATDDPMLGRVSGCTSCSLAALGEAWAAAWPARASDVSWTETIHVCTMEELSSTPPPPPVAPSLVTSAAASLASFLRGWAK